MFLFSNTETFFRSVSSSSCMVNNWPVKFGTIAKCVRLLHCAGELDGILHWNRYVILASGPRTVTSFHPIVDSHGFHVVTVILKLIFMPFQESHIKVHTFMIKYTIYTPVWYEGKIKRKRIKDLAKTCECFRKLYANYIARLCRFISPLTCDYM